MMITVKDVKVRRRVRDHTQYSKWETYWFDVGKQTTLGIEKSSGVFRFYSKSCPTLLSAKQHIVDWVNSGKSLLSI